MSTGIETKPTDDVYTNEWYRKQFAGLSHHFQRCMVEEADLQQQVRMLRKEVDQLAKQRKDDMARIGELQDRLDKASEVVADLKRQVKKEAA